MREPEMDRQFMQVMSIPDHCVYLRFNDDEDATWFQAWLNGRGWDAFVDWYERETRGDRW
jgi:hypothetical protein